MKEKLDIKVGDLVIFPIDKFNLKEEYGMVVSIIPYYFSEPDEDSEFDIHAGYRVEWFNIRDTDCTTEDIHEITQYRQVYLKKHPENESY